MKNKLFIVVVLGLVVLLGLLLYVSRDVETPATTVPVRTAVSRRPPRPAPVLVPSSKPVQRSRMVAMPLTPVDVAPTGSVQRVYTSTGRAVLKEGETLVTGGWATETGKRTWALITPNLISTNGETMVEFYSKIVSVPDELLTDPFWESLKATAPTNDEAGALAPEYVGELMDSWKDRKDVDLLSSPKITTRYGVEATIIEADTVSFDPKKGKMDYQKGVMLRVRPVVGGDGNLTLDVLAEARP